MKVLIIEDEAFAARQLMKLLEEINPAVKVEHCFESIEASGKLHLQKQNVAAWLAFLGERFVQTKFEHFERILQRFKRYKPQSTIRQLSSLASRVVSLADQFGEGWLIPAEISWLAEHGVNEILCLQPFGCIANHIVAKGVEKRMRELYPQLNLLYLDMDSGAGEVNLFNRIHFILQAAKESAEKAA